MLIQTKVFNEFGDWFSNRQPATSADSNLLFLKREQ